MASAPRPTIEGGFHHPAMPHGRKINMTCGNCQLICHPDRDERKRRYKLLSAAGYRNISGFNDAVEAGKVTSEDCGGPPNDSRFGPLPYMMVVIDELADLMMVAAKDIEDSICRLAQMARAVGMHLIVATQRPSTNVITGIIKANLPTRIAFRVASKVDSKVESEVESKAE